MRRQLKLLRPDPGKPYRVSHNRHAMRNRKAKTTQAPAQARRALKGIQRTEPKPPLVMVRTRRSGVIALSRHELHEDWLERQDVREWRRRRARGKAQRRARKQRRRAQKAR